MSTNRKPRAASRLALIAVAVTAMLAGVVAAAPAANAAPVVINGVRLNSVEARLLTRINAARAAKTLPRLRIAPGYTDVARRWSAKLAKRNVLGHNPDARAQLEAAGGTGWRVLGENVGFAGDADSLFEAYWNSPPHRANILNPAYRFIGIGWVPRADGTGYNTQNFLTCYSQRYGPSRVVMRGA